MPSTTQAPEPEQVAQAPPQHNAALPALKGSLRPHQHNGEGREHEHRAHIGIGRRWYVPDEPKFMSGARLRTLKEAYAPFFPAWNEATWKDLMADFGLDPAKKAGTLSLGQRTRFALTLAMSRSAELLVLDEPTTGLDPVFRRELLQRLAATLDERRSILFSTHITSDLEQRADLVTLIRDGEVVFSQSQDEVRETWAVVKGGMDLLDPEVRAGFAGMRTHACGFEGLTDDAEGARTRFQGHALVERASLEDILVLMGRRKAHA